MRRDQLEHAIRTACQVIERPEVIVVGSQAILGTFREDELPGQATMSSEIDILPIADSDEETVQLGDRIERLGMGRAIGFRLGQDEIAVEVRDTVSQGLNAALPAAIRQGSWP